MYRIFHRLPSAGFVFVADADDLTHAKYITESLRKKWPKKYSADNLAVIDLRVNAGESASGRTAIEDSRP